MAQSKELAALRMRLTRRGYMNIHIEISGPDYLLTVTEPLAGYKLQMRFREDEIKAIGRW